MGLSIVVRMESYSCNDRTDNADDATERKCVRVVSPARESETDMRIRKLEEHLERQNQEIKRLKTSANNVFFCSYQQSDNCGTMEHGGPNSIPPGERPGGLGEYRHGGLYQGPPGVSERP